MCSDAKQYYFGMVSCLLEDDSNIVIDPDGSQSCERFSECVVFEMCIVWVLFEKIQGHVYHALLSPGELREHFVVCGRADNLHVLTFFEVTFRFLIDGEEDFGRNVFVLVLPSPYFFSFFLGKMLDVRGVLVLRERKNLLSSKEVREFRAFLLDWLDQYSAPRRSETNF